MINFNDKPKVIISASGMCEAGRIRHHLKHNLWRKECTILFVGYQAVGTLGRKLVESKPESVRLFGENVEVNARIEVLAGISGHADMNGLLNWIDGFKEKPSHIFVVHGEDSVTDSFAATITDRFGIPAFAPYSGGCVDLATDTILSEGIRLPKKQLKSRPKHVLLLHSTAWLRQPNTSWMLCLKMKVLQTKILQNSSHRSRILPTNGIVTTDKYRSYLSRDRLPTRNAGLFLSFRQFFKKIQHFSMSNKIILFFPSSDKI